MEGGSDGGGRGEASGRIDGGEIEIEIERECCG